MIPEIRIRRSLPACAGSMLFLALAVLWLSGDHQPYRTFFLLLGIRPFVFPFFDTHAVLAAIECHRLGIDVYVTNPCDVEGRPHVYAPLWLHLGALPVTTAWTAPVGLVLDILFLASLIMLPPARRLWGTSVIIAATLSPSVALALERGNNDLLIFLFALLAGWLALRSSRLRLLGHVVVITATALKLYPVTLLILAARGQWRRGLAVIALSLAVLAACFLPELSDVMRGLRLVPAGARFGAFGAHNIPSIFTAGLNWPAWSGTLVQATLVLVMASRAWHWSHRLQPGLKRLSQAEQVFLTVGATLIVGCFLAGQSFGYRAIHLLFTLPALLALAAEADGRLARAATGLALLVMWGDALRTAPGPADWLLWLSQQCAWWGLVTLLLAALIALLRDSLALQSVRALPGPTWLKYTVQTTKEWCSRRSVCARG